jgi:hypothetical protein
MSAMKVQTAADEPVLPGADWRRCMIVRTTPNFCAATGRRKMQKPATF